MPEIFSNWGEKEDNSIIKVIGVGGGGGNAVKHMYKEGIVGINFLICNTDKQALENNPVPSKLVLGESGLGAGANPEAAELEAERSTDKIKEFLGDKTQMLFITAGMGKGTGTGASPVVAKIAKEMGIITIGVVCYPFKFEGAKRKKYADEGIEKLKKNVDSLIVINNQNIFKYYNDDDVSMAFAHADDVLKNAVKCIAELITVNAEQNVDFNDIKKITENSGVALLGLGCAEGENRVEEAITQALNCPLLNDNDITGAKNFLFFVSYGPDKPLKMTELEALTERFSELDCNTDELIWGRNENPNLGASIQLSIVATGFKAFQKNNTEVAVKIPETISKEIVTDVEDNNPTITVNTSHEEILKETIHNEILEKPTLQNITAIKEENSEVSHLSKEPSLSIPTTNAPSDTLFNQTFAAEINRYRTESCTLTPEKDDKADIKNYPNPSKPEITYDKNYNELFSNINRPAIWLNQKNTDLLQAESQEIADDSSSLFKNLAD